ncbi:MAG: ribosome biogenesis GTP-binding protein YsxC [Elusimicrobia bacterium GWA2_69_24]|nr:MAG: ribosome biogenesis GTP-binding protein YsxC [Elusimicrobia bacterium GWA2_69_24]HBL17276.1 ribosome biogenesis GTP-binding protein YsxC [Elusimicrobiota bacterium]
MAQLFENVTYLLSETVPERLGPCVAEVTFVGRSNVGKSSLLNALCRRNVARVSGTPGRTRTINVFLAGADRWLVDLPGYGYVKGRPGDRAGWGPMIESYLTGRPSLRMVFALVDAKVGPTELDAQMLDWLRDKGLPWRVVATKSDKVKGSRLAVQRRDVAGALGLRPEDIAWVSAAEGYGIHALRAEIAVLLKG